MRYVLLLITVLLVSAFTADNEPRYFSVVAENGDGVFSILRKYQLLGSKSNIDRFYNINKLDRESHLIKGQAYRLPVLIYPFDGTSIRSSIGIDNYERAKRIEEYNVRLAKKGILTQDYRESLELWVPIHMLDEAPNSVPAKAIARKTLEVDLFGPGHSTVDVTSDMLKGEVFYIISGHGGPDPGAMSEVNGRALCEDEYAYDVSLRLARKLMEHGATVEVIVQDLNDGIRDEQLLVCDKDEKSLGRTVIPIRQLTRLQQRVHEVNSLYSKYRKDGLKKHTVVCVHVDSRSPNSRQDVFFYHYEGSKTGRKLAYTLQKTFKDKYAKYRPNRNYSGTVSTRGLYVLRHTDPPAVYIELANIKNIQDRQRILPKENRQALANWIFEGLTR